MKQIKDSKVLNYLLITIGALMAGFSVATILLPNDTIDYGTAGIAIIISKLTGFNLSLCVAVVFLPFLIAGLLYLGREFFMRALCGTIFYTLGLGFFEAVSIELNTEHFIAVVIGGAILGMGLSIILRAGGCIDGSEILASIIVKKLGEKNNKNYSLTGVLIAFNAFVYLAAFLLINKSMALMSLMVYFAATIVIDHFTDHYEAVKQVTIISKSPEELIEAIRTEMNKTCTVINSQGAIAGNNKTVICYVNYFELQKLRQLIQKKRGASFITVSTIDEIIK